MDVKIEMPLGAALFLGPDVPVNRCSPFKGKACLLAFMMALGMSAGTGRQFVDWEGFFTGTAFPFQPCVRPGAGEAGELQLCHGEVLL